MKLNLSLIAICFPVVSSFAQPRVPEMIEAMKKLSNQYDDRYVPTGDLLTLILIPGTDDPFTKVYDKWKGKTWRSHANVVVIGGFKEMLGGGGHGASSEGVKKHVQDAFITRYGKTQFPILIDLPSETQTQTGTSGLSIIRINLKTNKIESIQEFGDDRKKFFDNVNPLFTK